MDFFSSFCSLRKVFLIRESDREGNQSYSNFLEVCKLAGVLTTINKPTTGLLSLPNMDNYTATRASGAPAPDFDSNLTLFLKFWLKFDPLSITTQPSTVTPNTAVSVKVNLRPILWQLSSQLRSDQIAFLFGSSNNPSCLDCNRQIGMSHSCFARTANMQRNLDNGSLIYPRAVCVYTFHGPWSWSCCNGNAFNGC